MRTLKQIFTVSITVMLLVGCNTTISTNRMNDAVEKTDESAFNEINRMRAYVNEQEKPPTALPNNWVNTSPVPYDKPLPSAFKKNGTLVVYEPEYATVLLGRVSRMMGIFIDIERDIFVKASGGTSGSSAEMDSTSSTASTDSPPPELNRVIPRFAFSYRGNMHGMLDKLASMLSARWRFDHKTRRIIYYRYESRAFHISAQPGRVTSTTTVTATNTSQGASASQSSNTATSDSQYSIWDSLEKDIDSMLSDEGKFSISEAAGIVIVRDLPEVVTSVGGYIKRLNASLEQGVAMDVQVYAVNIEDQDTNALSWNAIFDDTEVFGNLVTPRGPSALTDPSYLVLGKQDGDFAGSTVILDRLQRLGKVSLVTSGVLMSVNNKPAPISVAETIYYIAESSVTNTVNVGTQTSVTQEAINVGFFASLTPRVLENGDDLMMHVSINISRLVSLDSIQIGEVTLEQPRIEYRQLDPEVLIRSGQSLVIAGLSFITSQAERQGILSKETWWLGGGRELQELKNKIVIVMTPRVYRPSDFPGMPKRVTSNEYQ